MRAGPRRASDTHDSGQAGLETLSEAVAKTKGQSLHVHRRLRHADHGSRLGQRRWAATSLTMKVTDAASGATIDPLDGIVLAQGVYVKLDLGVLAALVPGFDSSKWMHIDPSKAPGAARLGIKPGQDTFGPDAFLKGATEANVSPTEITGKLDISKAAPVGVPADRAGQALRRRPQRGVHRDPRCAGPGRQAADEDALGGRLPGGGPDHDLCGLGCPGQPGPAAPPAADTVEAPALIYGFLQ